MAKRLSGIQGAIFLAGSSTKLGDSFMWEYEEQQEVLDASIKGEHFKRYAADVGTGRVRIQSFVPAPGSQTPLSGVMDANLVNAAGGGAPVDFILNMLDPTQTVFGQGYIVRSQLHVARDGIITDEIEITVDGQPVVN
jgi:hypothetical protein